MAAHSRTHPPPPTTPTNQRRPLDDPRVTQALSSLCEGSLKDPRTFKLMRFGLPNWFTAALILWITLLREQAKRAQQTGGAGAGNAAAAAAAGAAGAAGSGGEGMQGQQHQQHQPQPAASAAGGQGQPPRRSGATLCEEVFV